jgi:hypothetical protein
MFCLRNKEPADLERVISMIMQLTSGLTYDVQNVEGTPRHTGLHFSANQTQFMITGALSVFIETYFGNHQVSTRNRLQPRLPNNTYGV